MAAELINFTDVIPDKYKNHLPKDDTFSTHLIEQTSNILLIGPTGSGKTSGLLNFLARKNNSFVEIIVFTGSTVDEPLYRYLQDTNPDIQMIDDISELPNLTDYNEKNKNYERLIVFDDVANMSKKDETILKNWIKACRKYGFTAMFLYQTSTESSGGPPSFISSNCNIFMFWSMPDSRNIEHLLRGKTGDIGKKKLMDAYNYATKDKGSFLTIDSKAPRDRCFRKNFTEILNI